MDFSSSYVLVGNEEEEEEYEEVVIQLPRHVESYGFECAVMDFDDEPSEQTVRRQKPKVNTNTACCPLARLKEPREKVLLTKDCIPCKGESCRAILSHIDKPEGEDDSGKKIWICKFCGTKNSVDTWPDFEDKQDVEYVDDESHIPDIKEPTDGGTVIFVCDTSGSMTVTSNKYKRDCPTELNSLVVTELSASMVSMLANLGEQCDPDAIKREFEKHESLDIQRMQVVKAALISQLKKLAASQPNSKVALITFSDKITVYRPCPEGFHIQTVDKDQLTNYSEQTYEEKFDELTRIGHDNHELCSIGVNEAGARLEEKIMAFNAEGQTALGPALVIAQAMASPSRGSKIILCTDGIANVGFGNLETEDDSRGFYSDIMKRCKSSGTSVSIFSFADCKLTVLEELPRKTDGSVEKLEDPTAFEECIQKELRKRTIATNVTMDIVANKDMVIRGEIEGDHQDNELHNFIGNVSNVTTVTFSFGMKTPMDTADEGGAGTSTAVEPKSSYPFQVQILAKNMEGDWVKRVWTQTREVTNKRAEAEDGMNPTVTVNNFINQSCKSILEHQKQINSFDLIPKVTSMITGAKDQIMNPKIKQHRDLAQRLTAFLKDLDEINDTGKLDDGLISKLHAHITKTRNVAPS